MNKENHPKRKYVILAVIIFLILVWLNNTSLFLSNSGRMKYLAHRGLAQTFDVSLVEGDTNTAEVIYTPEHPYIENTIESMQAAFDCGADVVELDIQLTKDGKLAVFHDAILEYRTDGHGSIQDFTMEELKQLDVGYGYTADGGLSFPFRGKAIGMMPDLDEVFEAFPDKELLIHIKDGNIETADVLSSYLSQMDEDRFQQITIYGDNANIIQHLRDNNKDLRLLSKRMLKDALLPYAIFGFTGYIPDELHNMELHIPIKYAKFIWGWPNKFIERMEKVNTRVVLVVWDGKWSDGFDSIDSLEQIPKSYHGYIWTNRIDIVSGSNNR